MVNLKTSHSELTLKCLIEGWGRLLNFGFFFDPDGAY